MEQIITAKKFTTWYDGDGRRFVVVDFRGSVRGTEWQDTSVCLLEVETEKTTWLDEAQWEQLVLNKKLLKPLNPK